MAANVTVHHGAHGDTRYESLGETCGYNRHEALGRMVALWSVCTERHTDTPGESWIRSCLGRNGVQGLLESGLGENTGDGIRVKGCEGRTGWFKGVSAAQSEKGRARAAGASRTGGKFAAREKPPAAHQPGHQPGHQPEPAGPPAEHQPHQPLDSDLDLDPEEREERRLAEGTGIFEPLRLIPDLPASRSPSPAERFAQEAVAKINAATGRTFEADSKHTLKLCAALIRAGHTTADVSLVVEAKAAEWLGTKVAGRVCPATLLALENFDAYLDEAKAGPPRTRDPANTNDPQTAIRRIRDL